MSGSPRNPDRPSGASAADDAVALARALIRCPSVTPRDEGALDLLEQALSGLGFTCWRLPFSAPGTASVDNLFARIGSGSPHFCFAGHTDVVPVGRPENWTHEPFDGTVLDGMLIGRGAADMKSAIACFVAAAARYLADHDGRPPGSISLMITGDEEGPAINGTAKILKWMEQEGHVPDHCLVGEPTNPERLGEMVKIGRRGSLNGHLVLHGHQGHVAYPHLADNPIPKLARIIDRLTARSLDDGSADFQPSNLEVTNVEVGNRATNVIPSVAEASFNIRFNDRHRAEDLIDWLHEVCRSVAGNAYTLETDIKGEAFHTPRGPLTDAIHDAITERLGVEPEMSTSGGTSDARFIKDYCPVAEFGLVGATMHKANEQVRIADIEALSDIYYGVLGRIFGVRHRP